MNLFKQLKSIYCCNYYFKHKISKFINFLENDKIGINYIKYSF